MSNFNEPKKLHVFYEFIDNDKKSWRVLSHFQRKIESVLKNDKVNYHSEWLIVLQQEGQRLPMSILLLTEHNLIPNKLQIMKAIQEYFSSLVLNFAIDSSISF